MYRTDFWTLWERERVGWFGRMALKHVYYQVRNESPVYVRYRIQDAWGWCTGMIQRDDMGWEGVSGLGTHVHPWWIHVNVWQNQYSIVKQNKVKIKIKKKENMCLNAVFRRIYKTMLQSFVWTLLVLFYGINSSWRFSLIMSNLRNSTQYFVMTYKGNRI